MCQPRFHAKLWIVHKNTPLTRNLYHNSTLQTTGLVLAESTVKPFLTRDLYETLILIRWLVRAKETPSPQLSVTP